MSNKTKLCNNDDVNNKMQHLIETAKHIPFSEPYDYLNAIYEKLKSNSDTLNSLQNIECFFVDKIFREIINNTNRFNSSVISLNQIQSNDILFIKCPSIFADYHFIVVCINSNKTQASIYQSFGSSMQLHQIIMPFNEFFSLMQQLYTFGTDGHNFNDDFLMMKQIESKLYGLDVDTYITSQQKWYDDNDSDSDMSDSDDSIRLDAERLGLSSIYYENLERMYELNKNNNIIITAYRIKNVVGGKKRASKRKSYKKTVHRKKQKTIKKRK